MILGPLAEQEFRRAMTISQGDLMIFLQKPLSLALLLIALLALAGPKSLGDGEAELVSSALN